MDFVEREARGVVEVLTVPLMLRVGVTVRAGVGVEEGEADWDGQGVEEWEAVMELEEEVEPEEDTEGLPVPLSRRKGVWQGEGEVVGVVRCEGEADIRVEGVGVAVSQALFVWVMVGVGVDFLRMEALEEAVRVAAPRGEGESPAAREGEGMGVLVEVVEGVVEGVPCRVPDTREEGEGGTLEGETLGDPEVVVDREASPRTGVGEAMGEREALRALGETELEADAEGVEDTVSRTERVEEGVMEGLGEKVETPDRDTVEEVEGVEVGVWELDTVWVPQLVGVMVMETLPVGVWGAEGLRSVEEVVVGVMEMVGATLLEAPPVGVMVGEEVGVAAATVGEVRVEAEGEDVEVMEKVPPPPIPAPPLLLGDTLGEPVMDRVGGRVAESEGLPEEEGEARGE